MTVSDRTATRTRRSRKPVEPDDGHNGFQRVALLLQGGGALGAYQAGAYQALDEAGIVPNWIVGISIGAINAALIAGNAPGERVAKLRLFWEMVTDPPLSRPSNGSACSLRRATASTNWSTSCKPAKFC